MGMNAFCSRGHKIGAKKAFRGSNSFEMQAGEVHLQTVPARADATARIALPFMPSEP